MMFFLFNSFSLCSSLIYKCLGIFSNLYSYNYKLLLINSSYNFINLISKLQIYFNSFYKQVDESITQNPTLLDLRNNILSNFKYIVDDIELIKGGLSYREIIDNYDFIIYSNNDNGDSKLINKVIIDNPSNPSGCFKKYKVSNVKFILLELYIGEKNYVINLKNDIYNFYIEGNKFNLSFFEYYVKTILNSDIRINVDDKITLTILDENVNNVQIELYPKYQSILLEQNNYQIIT